MTIKRVLQIVPVLLMCCIYSPQAHTQVPATCDIDYYDVLSARSYLEGKRELEAAQHIILKADSVLEYSCFHLDVDLVGRWGATFSENQLPAAIRPADFNGGVSIFGGNLDNALTVTVYNTLIEYLDNFGHVYGGGTFTSLVGLGSTSCNPMNIVWHGLKCENFDESTWTKFSDFISTDIRSLPEPCAPYAANRNTLVSAAYAAIYPAAASPYASGGIESTQDFIDYENDCSAAVPIQTGLQSTDSAGTTIIDAVCLPPKCAYDGSGGCN